MDIIKENINLIYKTLLNTYSYQGWWPTSTFKDNKRIKTHHYDLDYTFPQDDNDKFEIIIGAILTQNTTWVSVDKSLSNLRRFTDFNAENLLNFLEEDSDKFKQSIRPTGYYNQKYEYIKNIAKFFINLKGKTPSRKEILEVKGVGNETADSILLYAFGEKEFVVDAYTKRMFSKLGFFKENATYYQIKKIFENNFSGNIKDYQEYHGLIVEHGKYYYRKKPYGVNDKLLNNFYIEMIK